MPEGVFFTCLEELDSVDFWGANVKLSVENHYVQIQ